MFTIAVALLLATPDTSLRVRLVPLLPSELAGAAATDTIRKQPADGGTVFTKKRDSVVTTADSATAMLTKVAADSSGGARTVTASPAAAPTVAAAEVVAAQDTTPRRRKRVQAVEYSEGYGQRLTWHRWLSYSIVPLFAAQYYFGEKLMEDQRGASDLTKNGHRAIATMTAGLYTFNTVTGVMNLWEGRHDPSGRFRKLLHAAMFVTADAGFVYGATLAGDAQKYGQEFRDKHRTVELASIGVSVASWAMMLLWKD